MSQQPDLDPAFASASYTRDLALRVTPVPEVSEPVHAVPNALREIPGAHEITRPLGWVRGALMGGAAMALLLVMVRASRSRPRRRRSPRARIATELAREVGTRMLVSAASVVAARIASDVIAPRIAERVRERFDR